MDVLGRAVVFLLEDFVERQRQKHVRCIQMGVEFKDDATLVEAMKLEADKLAGRIEEAEALRKALQKLS